MEFIISGLISLIAVVIILLGGKWKQQHWARKGVPQLRPDVIFGDYKLMMTGKQSVQDFYEKLYSYAKSKGYRYIGIYTCWFPEFVPIDPEIVKLILTRDSQYFESHGVFGQEKDPFSLNLFTMEGQAWKELRAKLTPVFTSGKMKMMFPVVVSKAEVLRNVVNESIDANISLNLKDTVARYTTDVIAACVFGLDCDTLRRPDHIFREIGKKAMMPRTREFFLENFFNHKLLANLGYRSQRNDVETYFSKIVRDTIHYRETTSNHKNDFINIMLHLKHDGVLTMNGNEHKHQLTDQEIVNESFLFYLAGFETSASTMTFAVYELSQNQDIQDQLRQEINDVWEKYNGKITYDALMEMEYLEQIIKETLRLYPVIAQLPRVCTKDYTIPNTNIKIKKGTKVTIPVIGLQHDPEFYTNPEEFNPDNFNTKNTNKRPDASWLPFGKGPRECPGIRFGPMQAKIGLVYLIKHFRITLDETVPNTNCHKLKTGSVLYQFERDPMIKATRV